LDGNLIIINYYKKKELMKGMGEELFTTCAGVKPQSTVRIEIPGVQIKIGSRVV
jgi:hypothetical protein